MSKLGIHEKFITWNIMQFSNAHAFVGLNGSLGNDFNIEMGVRQGCPLAPYLFLIVGEVLNHIFKEAIREGRILGVRLRGGKQQCILQYANNSSLLLRGEKSSIDEMVRLLKVFCMESRMEINCHKSCAYWVDRRTSKPSWLDLYD